MQLMAFWINGALRIEETNDWSDQIADDEGLASNTRLKVHDLFKRKTC